MKFLLVVLLICLIGTPPLCFSLDPSRKISQYVHDQWGLRSGLPHSSVGPILQTHDGYLWLATEEGLARFDGVHFTVFDKAGVDEMDDNFITALHEDSQKNLWLGTFQGNMVCKKAKGAGFLKLPPPPRLGNSMILELFSRKNNILWVIREEGIQTLNMTTRQWISEPPRFHLENDQIKSALMEKDGSLWIGTQKYLYYLSLKDPQPVRFTLDRREPNRKRNIRSLLRDHRGTLWMGTDKGVYCLEPGSKSVLIKKLWDRPVSSRILKIFEDKRHILWFGTDRGVYRWHPKTRTISRYSVSDGLSDDEVLDIMEDREGSLWVGTNFGLNRFKEGPFVSYSISEGLSVDTVWSVLEDNKGKLWIGSSRGLNRFDPQTGKVAIINTTYGLCGNNVYSLTLDRNGHLWVGTTRGLNRINPETGQVLDAFTEARGLSNNTVMCIFESKDGTLWIGTEKGLNRMEAGPTHARIVSVFTEAQGLSNNYIRVMIQDKHRNLWIGTRGGGINRLNPDTGQISHITTKTGEGLSNDYIRSLYIDEKDVLWIGTKGGGLNRLKNGKIIAANTDTGFYDDTLHNILEDKKHNFWMGCNKGVFRVPKADLNRFCDNFNLKNLIGSFDLRVFNEDDGMRTQECNGISQPSSWKGRDGKFWFATMKGVAVVTPGKISVNRQPPPMMIEEFICDSTRYYPPFNNTIMLPAGTERIEIRFTALSFLYPEKVRFKYQLEGLDEKWDHETRERKVSYISLKPGKYVFRVQACNNDGLWNKAGTFVAFHLEPYFYQTRLFYLLIALTVVLLVYSGYRFRVRQFKKRRKELEFLVNVRTDQLQQANVELATLLENLKEANERAEKERETAVAANKIKSQFLANMSHEIRTPMNAILGFAEILESELEDPKLKRHLSAISVSGKTLMQLINDILDLSRIEAGRMELQFEPANPRAILDEIGYTFSEKAREQGLNFYTHLDSTLPKAVIIDGLRVRQVLYNLVGNAVKFTHRGYIKLSASARLINTTATKPSDEPRVDLVFSVEDTGIGIPPDQQQVIFESFRQQEGQNAEKYGGTGLGLSITRQLVQLMGGDISLTSTIGKGSTFTVTLNNVALAASDVEIEAEVKLDVEGVRFKESLVLIADHYKQNRQLVKCYLGDSPIDFIEAENGNEVVELTRRYRPDLVLMDMKMPQLSGSRASRLLKNHRELKDIPVVLITAAALKDQRREIQESSCDGYLVKPVSKSDLIIELMHFLPFTGTQNVKTSETAQKKIEVEDSMLLSTETRSQLPELVTQLSEGDIIQRWEIIRKNPILDEIEDFLVEIKELDNRYGTGILTQWAQQLEHHLHSFDLPKMQETLDLLPQVIQRLTALSGQGDDQ